MSGVDKKYIADSWNYYLSIERDLERTSSYVDPDGQENVYSYEFAKIIISASVEAETILKTMCADICGSAGQSMKHYRTTLLNAFPGIVDDKVFSRRLRQTIAPFADWNKKSLTWWRAYCDIKHDRVNNKKKASLINAVNATAAVYILLFYLAEMNKLDFAVYESSYFVSEYGFKFLFNPPQNPLPGFSLKEYDGYYTYSDEA